MKPNEWLNLVKKHIESPETVTDDEMAQLRTNYEVWKEALTYHSQEHKLLFAKTCRGIFGASRIDDTDWNELTKQGKVPEGFTQEQAETVKAAYEKNGEELMKIHVSRSHMKFLKKFDEEFVSKNGELSSEVQDMIWKVRAERLSKAIETHRHAHVLANKEPNGLDFALWREVDLEDFHASKHAGIEKNGYLVFQEG